MKKIFAVLIVMTLTIATSVGCSTSNNTPANSSTENSSTSSSNENTSKEGVTEEGKTYKVAYVARTLNEAFPPWLANAIQAEADNNYPDIKLDVFDGQNRNDLIANLIENAVVSQYDLILLQPMDSEAQIAPVQAALDAGVKVVTVNNRVNGEIVNGAVDVDPVEQSAKSARLAVEQIPENGKVVVLMGPPGNMHSDERRVGWQKYFFDERPDVTILDEQIANWNKDEAMRYMEDWIQTYDHIDAIVSMNDNMALGALEAAKGGGIEDIYAYGVDGDVEAVIAIKEGKMTSTTFQNPYLLAETAVKMVHDVLTGKEVDKLVMVETPLVTQENADEILAIHEKSRETMK